jgi:carbonic anhydrase
MDRHGQNASFTTHVTELNIANTLKNIYLKSEILKTMINQDQIGMVGAIYDVNTGKVKYKSFSSELNQLDHSKNGALVEQLKLQTVLEQSGIKFTS